MDFNKFDEAVDVKQLAHDVEEAAKSSSRDFPVIPAGIYTVVPEKLELGETKDHRPMVKAQFVISEGEYIKRRLFYNRVVFGTKNDANMIAAAIGFLNKLEPSEDVGPVVFESYSQFSDLILDIAEDIIDVMEYEVEYNPEAFNSISIIDAYEV